MVVEKAMVVVEKAMVVVEEAMVVEKVVVVVEKAVVLIVGRVMGVMEVMGAMVAVEVHTTTLLDLVCHMTNYTSSPLPLQMYL